MKKNSSHILLKDFLFSSSKMQSLQEVKIPLTVKITIFKTDQPYQIETTEEFKIAQ